jgi:hypothetical protein
VDSLLRSIGIRAQKQTSTSSGKDGYCFKTIFCCFSLLDATAGAHCWTWPTGATAGADEGRKMGKTIKKRI